MLTDDEIVKLLKEAYEAKLPDWKLLYMKRIANNLQVHTKGLLFSKVDTLFPHEHPDSKAHCVNTYEPITKGSIWKSINNIGRIFSNSSFTVSASDNTLLSINENNFTGQNLFSWFIEHWISQVIATDPNCLCAVYPPEYIKDHSGDQVRFISNDLVRMVSPDTIVFVSEFDSEKTYTAVDNIVKSELFYDDEIKSLNSRRIVEKTYNQQVVCKITKPVYHVFTKEYFLTFTEDNGKYDYTFYYHQNAFAEIPAFRASGVVTQPDIRESFVSSFIPFGNLALLQHRNHRAVDLMFSYPRMSEIEIPCDNQKCNEGYVRDITNPDNEVECSRCHGSGFITGQSPYKVYKKKIDTGLADPELVKLLLAANPVDYHTPDVSILDYSKDSWKEYLSMAEEAVFIQQKQETGNTESAKAKQIDKEGEYSWVMNISKALNTDLKKVIQAQENYLNANPATVSLEQPISFALVTETEAFEALDIIISSEAPVFIKSQQVENFINKFVSKSSPIVKALKILKNIDPLWAYSNSDIQTFKSNNAVSTSAWTTHIYAFTILMRLYEADKELFDKKEADIIQMINDEIDKLKPDESTGLKGSLMKQLGLGKPTPQALVVKKDSPVLQADEAVT